MSVWKKQKPEKTYKVICPTCEKWHEIDLKTYNQFGPDCECMKCIDWKHIQFMRNNKAGIKTCVKGCKCGFGG